MKNKKRELQLELHRRGRHGRKYWSLKYRRLHADGKSWGKWQRVRCDEEHDCRLPQPIFGTLVKHVFHLIKIERLSTKDKTLDRLSPILIRGIRETPELTGCRQLRAKQDKKVGVTWFLDDERWFAIRVLDFSSHAIIRDPRQIAKALRQDSGEAGHRFRRMEDKSRAPLRGAFVVFRSGFCRFVPARAR